MPSTNDNLLDIDDEQVLSEAPTSAAPVAAKKDKKSKKKKGSNVAKTRAHIEDEEPMAFASSVSPSPPDNYGVQLDTPPRVESAPPHEAPSPPPVFPDTALLDEQYGGLEELALDDEAPEIEQVEPIRPLSPPSLPAPIRLPAARPVLLPSPRPAAAIPAIPPASPAYRPASIARPPHNYPARGAYRANSMTTPPGQYIPRRDSYSAQQRSPEPRALDPPLPHMPQQHFFGLPDWGAGLAQKQEHVGQPAGSDGYCCRLDSFADAGDAASARKARDALLVGSEGALDVYKVLPDRMELAGRLEGLRGAVIDAKIVPHTSVYDSVQVLRPLVAVIVQGPARDDDEEAVEDDVKDGNLYQTVVEVYSLRTHERITTLYQSTTVRKDQPVMGHLALPPKPVGELSLNAAGSFITISSGRSGEVFIFSAAASDETNGMNFRCIGKYWTAIQRRHDNSRPSTAVDGSSVNTTNTPPCVPLMTLSARWLAIVPPYTTPGTPLVADEGPQPHGLGTHVAPSQPLLTCEVAGVDIESTLDWLSRTAAQGLVKASQKGYEMGIQGWKELTHPSPPSTTQKPSADPAFPPTNGPSDDPRRLAKEPAIVSIIDLQRLLEADEQRLKQAPAPLATFALVEGCNYLSFSPDGLRLLTSNRKGEVTSIWNLANAAHGSTKKDIVKPGEVEHAPHVKLMLRIARSSPSVIADSVWTRDGDWLALLTTHGTIHLHETPVTAPRKRKRASTIAAPAPEKAEATVSLSQGFSPPSNGFFGGLRAMSRTVSTGVNAVKTQYALPNSFAGFRETAAAARTAGQRVVAKSLRDGYSAARSGVGDMWHAEDNKVRPKALQEGTVKAGSIQWVQKQSGSNLAVVAGGTVHLHPVQRVMRQKGDATVSGLKKDKKSRDFPLPRISTIRDGALNKANANCAKAGPHGFWSLRLNPNDKDKTHKRGSSAAAPAPTTSLNEVETNPPYCPFHIDNRVSIFAYEDSTYGSAADLQGQLNEQAMFDFKTKGTGFAEHDEPWMFGEALRTSIKLNEHARNDRPSSARAQQDYEDDDVDAAIVAGMIESRLTVHRSTEDGRPEIRVHSRPSARRGGSAMMEEVAGFDVVEDECESVY
ncbi:hypothetical protein LTR86_007826 [Recurvomyces mirabilis]|nr:hypothetical protein LTR86_007826 [Recurvomyces mirabilis]